MCYQLKCPDWMLSQAFTFSPRDAHGNIAHYVLLELPYLFNSFSSLLHFRLKLLLLLVFIDGFTRAQGRVPILTLSAWHFVPGAALMVSPGRLFTIGAGRAATTSFITISLPAPFPLFSSIVSWPLPLPGARAPSPVFVAAVRWTWGRTRTVPLSIFGHISTNKNTFVNNQELNKPPSSWLIEGFIN